MKVEKVREKDGKLELMVQLDGDEVAKEMRRIALFELSKLGNGAPQSIDDPIDVLRKQHGVDEASFIFDEALMNRRAHFALAAVEVDVIGKPVFRCLEHAQEGKPFTYHLVCVPVPEFTLESFDPVSITLPAASVKSSEIDTEIQKMAESSSIPVTDTSHNTVAKGDKVELAMQTMQNGVPVKPLCTEGREYHTGVLAMPDDFDDAIIGMQVGETKSFTFEGPDMVLDADGRVKMDAYDTTVTVKRIIQMEQPAVDDEWAKTALPGVETLQELRVKVEEKLRKQRENDQQKQAELLAANELAKRLEGEISDLIYGVALKEAREGLSRRLQNERMSLEDYCKQQGIEKDQLNNMLLLDVRSQLSRQLALNTYAKHKNLTVNDDDILEFFDSIAPNHAHQALGDFRRDGRMYAARCAALRLKANKELVKEAEINVLGASEEADLHVEQGAH